MLSVAIVLNKQQTETLPAMKTPRQLLTSLFTLSAAVLFAAGCQSAPKTAPPTQVEDLSFPRALDVSASRCVAALELKPVARSRSASCRCTRMVRAPSEKPFLARHRSKVVGWVCGCAAAGRQGRSI